MRCDACNASLSEVDTRAKNDCGIFYDLCGKCRGFVKSYFTNTIIDPDQEVIFEAIDPDEDGDQRELARRYANAERLELSDEY